jgi:hypothetical protein
LDYEKLIDWPRVRHPTCFEGWQEITMRKLLAAHLVLLSSLFVCARGGAQTLQVSLFGHRLGESGNDFVKEDPAVADRLALCHQLTSEWYETMASPPTPTETQDPGDPDTGFTAPSQQVNQAEFRLSLHQCAQVTMALDKAGDSFFDTWNGDPNTIDNFGVPVATRWYFHSGVLYAIELMFENAIFEKVQDFVSTTLASEPKDITFKNTDSREEATSKEAVWESEGIHCVLTETAGEASDYSTLRVERLNE